MSRRAEDPRLVARDAIVRLAATPAHRGNIDAAAAELANTPHWQRRPHTLAGGVVLARAIVEIWGSARAAERALNAEADRRAEQLLDAETGGAW